MILLLQNDGKTQQEIALFLGCSLRTVAYWCMHGDPEQLESLHNKREQKSYRKATPEYIKVLLETVEKQPFELGYEFGRWTGERLAVYLAIATGIKLSGSQVRRILKQKKYSYIWAKYSLEDKQDKTARNGRLECGNKFPHRRPHEFKQKLDKYLGCARKEPELLQIWFWDESGFSLRVIRRKNWSKKGKRRQITGQRSGGRVNVMGGIRESDRKQVCFFVKKGDGDIFYEQLQQLYEFVRSEWIEKGNKSEDFSSKGPKIIVILDNASYHKRRDIRGKIERELTNIILEYLPAYSPDFNLIELVWHSCKEYIAHRLFKSVDELTNLLTRLLNGGELVIKWQRQIKNKGNKLCAT